MGSPPTEAPNAGAVCAVCHTGSSVADDTCLLYDEVNTELMSGHIGFFSAHCAVVTNAIFAPRPELIIRSQFEYIDDDERNSSAGVRGEVLISADYAGLIRVFINKFKPGSG